MDSASNDRAQLPRNMIENSMFEEEPDVVDLAKEPTLNPLESEEVEYEPRSSRLLVRGLGEHEMDDDEEDYESSAKLLGMSFMNRSSGLRNNVGNYRQAQEGLCPVPSARTVIVSVVVVVILVSIVTVIYLLPKCTFTKEGCHKKTQPVELIYPIATNGQRFPWTKSRLPNYIKPLEYNITLYPNLTTMTFSGKVNIKLNATGNANAIVLHSSGLQDIQANVTLRSGATHNLSVLEYPTFEMIAMVLPETLQKGTECLLTIEYHSNFSTSYYGFYKMSYVKEQNISTWLAATQFEPLAARKAFPCFDEPAFKSTFRLEIKRSEEHTALSNMPKIKTTVLPDGRLDEFATSVKMSTYLVAFIVSDMKNVTKDANGTLVSIYAIPQKIDQAQYALDTAITLLEFFSDYFGIKYPLPKLDLVAIPDIQAGAMENWGLLTFRETTLLYTENSSSLMDKQLITQVIAHELAHQWFGNLVTMEWWNDLWLNEGFATYMEYFALQSKFKDLNADDKFLKARCDAMDKDSLQTTHAISTDVQSPEQIEEMFDDLSYIKGASILQMLNVYLTTDIFHKCIEKYLSDHKYETTKSDGLWDSMNQVVGSSRDVKNIMKTWTQQAGYPLVTVEKKGKEVYVSQERFLRTVNSSKATGNSSTLWHVPLSYIFGPCNGPSENGSFLLNQTQGKIGLPSEPCWLKFNVNMTGYYIVDYGHDGWDALIKQLRSNPTVFAASDRVNLIHDIFVLSGVGKEPLLRAFDLLAYLVNETEPAPIQQALHQTRIIHSLLAKQGFSYLAANLEMRIFNLLRDKIDNQKWTDDGTLSAQELRSLLLDLACMHGDDHCINEATQLFNIWQYNGTRLPTAVKKIVFKVGAHTDDGWGYLYSMYNTSLSEAEKIKMLEGLASTDDGKKLQWLMSASLHGEDIRTQDFPAVIHFISKNVPGFLLAWNFVKQNWDEITQKFPPGSFPIQSIVTKVTANFGTEVYLNEVINFFNSTKGKSRDMWCVKEAIEAIKLNIQWIDKNRDNLNWL
ncbi:leucyl-cystinyl aminopeptidase isoform X2 [Eleutherodactylus coqui]|uniref:leucyl-cystinyl aminopeptidase isoform X2 n=1 Tax=Eleutherodactylus coqui TaxID=57060 RepID=UPI003462AEED